MELSTYLVETWGCQMNVHDSGHLAALLERRGLRAAAGADDADLVLLNTCSVRDKAVQKVLSRLGELRVMAEERGRPRVVGLCGCVAQQEGARLFDRGRTVRFVLGPGRIGQLDAAIDAAMAGERTSFLGFASDRDLDAPPLAHEAGHRRFVTVVHGCSQHCTFCVVPYTRGPEVSRPLAAITREVSALAAAGAKEVTLLGQTVNAYRCPDSGADLAALLEAVCAVDGPWRIQFLTSHPRFFSDRLIGTMARLDRLGSMLHLPFQAGSNRVLKRMHRRYTHEEYVSLVERIRAALPEVTLSTDVIVGFPGEEDEDFQATLELVEEVRFGQLYGFAFSPRPHTPAARYSHSVDRGLAGERLSRLFERQSAIQLELNSALVGRSVELLVDGPARRGEGLWQGRGDDNRVVNFPSWEGIARGDTATVTITGATAHALLGARCSTVAAQRPTAIA